MTDDRTTSRTGRSEDRAVYIISVAAEIAGVHPQTLRMYERKGLLQPQRSQGKARRYSERDIMRLRAIQSLTQDEGINLAGVKRIMELEAEAEALRERVRQLEAEVASRAIPMAGRRIGVGIVPRTAVFRFPWEEDR